jgi:hypothetical protein
VEHDGISELWKVAPKRLADARELLEPRSLEAERSDRATRHLRGAVYLAGYAVECILKVYIIERTDAHLRTPGRRVQKWSEALATREAVGERPDLRGARSHNLFLLFGATDLSQHMSASDGIYETWTRCFKHWNASLRYNPRPIADPDEALRTVDALDTAFRWVKARTWHRG